MKKLVMALVMLVVFSSVVLATGGKSLFSILARDQIGLCYKSEATGWQCAEGPEGKVSYRIVNNKLNMNVFVKGLNCDGMKYQLTLNGAGDEVDNADTKIGGNCANPNGPMAGFDTAWECGMWGSEGFWNFEMEAEPMESSSKCKWEKIKQCYNWKGQKHCAYKWKKFCDTEKICQIKKSYNLDMPIGVYKGIKFVVKEASDDPRHYSGPWIPVSMETEQMNFAIV